PKLSAAQRAHYFRAFDFQTGPNKEEALAKLLDVKLDPSSLAEVVVRLRTSSRNSARVKQIVNSMLDSAKGTPAFIDLVEQFDVKDRNEEVLGVVLANPAGQSAATGVRILMRNGGSGLIEKALSGAEGDKLAQALGSSPERAVAEIHAGLVRDDA